MRHPELDQYEMSPISAEDNDAARMCVYVGHMTYDLIAFQMENAFRGIYVNLLFAGKPDVTTSHPDDNIVVIIDPPGDVRDPTTLYIAPTDWRWGGDEPLATRVLGYVDGIPS